MTARWRHRANTIELVLPLAHQTPQHKRQIDRFSHFWATVYGSPYAIGALSCLSVLSVTLVYMYCGQTVGWIKVKLGMEVGLGPCRIVLDGAQLSPKRGTVPSQFSAHVCCGQTATWY